jgi:hypothetical protein
MKTLMILLSFIAIAIMQMVPDIGRAIRKKLYAERGSIAEGNRLNDILKYEQDNNFSREAVIIKTGQDLAVGAVLGKTTLGACPATGSLLSGATGAGTMTGVTAGAKAKKGTYTIKCVNVVTGAGLFSVEDPDGIGLPNAVAGVAYVHDQINFTINDGSPDFAVGDTFTVTIPAGDGDCVAIDFDAVDGSQNAYGILTAACDASLADKPAVAIVREAVVIEANLVWRTTSPAVSDDQKAAAMAQLAAKNIITAKEV